MMKIHYSETANYKEAIKSGLVRDKYSEIRIRAHEIMPVINAINACFNTNLNANGTPFSELELLVWLPDEEGDPNSFQITINERYIFAKSEEIVRKILALLEENAFVVEEVRITRDYEVDAFLAEQFLNGLKEGDIFENILENVSKICLIDWKTVQENKRIALLVDEFEEILFGELVNKKIRVNGKAGILKEVQGDHGRYGFFERGVRKDYDSLSLVQKMGAKTIRDIGF